MFCRAVELSQLPVEFAVRPSLVCAAVRATATLSDTVACGFSVGVIDNAVKDTGTLCFTNCVPKIASHIGGTSKPGTKPAGVVAVLSAFAAAGVQSLLRELRMDVALAGSTLKNLHGQSTQHQCFKVKLLPQQ
jgi:hypothetical protein